MRYVDKSFWIGRVLVSLVVVDLFVNSRYEGDIYPILRIDFMKGNKDKAYGISIAIPWVKFSIGIQL